MINKVSLDDNILKSRILSNIETLEYLYPLTKTIKYNKHLAKFIRENTPVRVSCKKFDVDKNIKMTYSILKHLVNSGVEPSKIAIFSIDECYSTIRGFGEHYQIKQKIFNKDNQVIVIEGLRDFRTTDVLDNVYSFWKTLYSFCLKNNNINVIFCFDESNSSNWCTPEMMDNWNKIGFKEI